MGLAGNVCEPERDELRSFSDGGEGSSGITGGEFTFFLLDGGTNGEGRTMGTGSFSRALYTRYIAYKTKHSQSKQNNYPLHNYADSTSLRQHKYLN